MSRTGSTVPPRPARRYPAQLIGLCALLLLVVPREGCSFTAGPNGLCAVLRVGPQDTVLSVGETFHVRINAGCPAGAACPCADSALVDARWRSDAPETATVDSTGLVTARRPGSADIVILPGAPASWRATRVHVTVAP